MLRNYGYQSQENSLDYSATGINRREDSISFWEDEIGHIDWKNTDTYPISVLNVYPESSRLTDLLITNKTGIKLRSDIFGNEFYFIKPVYPKRYAGTSYIEAGAAKPSDTLSHNVVWLTINSSYIPVKVLYVVPVAWNSSAVNLLAKSSTTDTILSKNLFCF